MTEEGPFTTHVDDYDTWFDEHSAAYVSELLAVRALLPPQGQTLEIGVGTGRFAAPLGVRVGVDPSVTALARAAKRGIRTVTGTAESLPFPDSSFDHALVITTICFVDSPATMFAEARRVLRPGGSIVVGFIDRFSPLGLQYLEHQADNVFYREATFFSSDEVAELLRTAGFTITSWAQTLAGDAEITEVEPALDGTGAGAFVVVAARSPAAEPGRLPDQD
jgi:SAM-dependent methyltransferase